MKPTTIFIFLWILIVTRGPASAALINFMNPERFVDHSILKQLESTGFINHVAGQYGIK